MEYKKTCKYCGKEFITHKEKAEFCCHECNQTYHDNINREKRMKALIENGIEGEDYVIDLWNGLPTPRIYGKWMSKMHPGKTTEDYKKDFPGAPLCCSKDKERTSKNSGKFMKEEKYRKMYSELLKGDKNPNSKKNTTEQERKERSPFSKEFYIKHNLSESDRQNFIKKATSNIISTTKLEYYLNKGYSRSEAITLLKDRQRTNCIETYIKKYGEELGPIKFNERNKNWSIKMEEKYSNGEYSKMPKHLGLMYSNKEMNLFDILLEELGLNYDDVNIAKSNKGQLKIFYPEGKRNFFYDFCYNNKIIEFNGDFWHCNPNMYKENDVNPYNGYTAKEIWKRDELKKAIAENNGYEVLIVWESEYEKNLAEVIKRCRDFIL